MSGSRLSYRFGPLERRGLLGPVRGGQAAVVAAGTLIAVIALDATPSAGGALVGLLALVCAVTVATAPIGARSAEEWAPVLCAFAVRRLSRRQRFRSPLPARGFRVQDRGAGAEPGEPAVPAALRGVRILDAAYRERRIGIVSERGGRRLTAVIACRVIAFSLLDVADQERRLARWGSILSGIASTPIRRLQWIERTAPARGDELARWLQAERDPAVPLRGTPMIESYLELIGTTARVAQEHEILLAVQVDERRVRGRGSAAVVRALIDETERIAQGLHAAEVTVLGALGPDQLARSMRTAFDPFSGAELAALEAADPERCGLPEAGAWPRIDVSPMFMDALLGRSSAVRTVSVTFEPIPPERSTREVEAAITRDHADRDLRRRFGQSETARHQQAQEATVRRESELAAGHSEMRLAGFITVSGRDREELRRAGVEVLEHAARARLELRCMYGQQAEAFTFTLPLCRGLA
jgi:hypothetical protein